MIEGNDYNNNDISIDSIFHVNKNNEVLVSSDDSDFDYSHYSLLPKANYENILYKLQSNNYDESIINIDEKNSINERDKTKATQKINQNKSITEKILLKKDAISTYNKQKYNLDTIKECLSKNIAPIEFNIINENMNYNEKVEKAEKNLQFTKTKRRRLKNKENETENNNNLDNKIERNKRGRKTKNVNNLLKEHDKYSDDNMIKKIKSKLFEYSRTFLNKMLEKYNDKGKSVLMQLDYKKYIDRLNREQDLMFLNMPLKDLFSNDISFKCQLKNIEKVKDYNKKKIEAILHNETDNTILFALNMTFIEWLDIFTFKTSLNDVIHKYNIEKNMDVDLQKIDKNLIKVDDLLKNKLKNNLDEFSLFIFYLYNYELWFNKKVGRKSKLSH